MIMIIKVKMKNYKDQNNYLIHIHLHNYFPILSMMHLLMYNIMKAHYLLLLLMENLETMLGIVRVLRKLLIYHLNKILK